MLLNRISGFVLIALLLPAEAAPPAIQSAPANLVRTLDLSVPGYGPPKLRSDAFVAGQDPFNRWLIHIGKYGGDGDHTGDILMVFALRLAEGRPSKVLEYPLEEATIEAKEGVILIRGRHVLSFCNGCDGWEVSSPEDLFFVPVEIALPGPTIHATLSAKDSEALLLKVEAAANRNKKEQAQWHKNGSYNKFADSVVARARSLLKQHNRSLQPTASGGG